jgi:hypothetical protein
LATILHQQLFSWEDIDHSSDLYRLQLALEFLPDEGIVEALERLRGHGTDRYPIRPTWNALIAGVVLQHRTVESLLRELRRNAELRQVCGFNLVLGSGAVPTPWAMSRFIRNVINHRDLIEKMFDDLVEVLHEALPKFGKHLAFDGKPIRAYSRGEVSRETGLTSDPDAEWGFKTTKGTDPAGRGWKKVSKWFGYQLHLIVDTTYELPVAFELEPASASEVKRLVPMVETLATKHRTLIDDCSDLAADKGLDSGPVNAQLWGGFSIKPVIDTRRYWRSDADPHAVLEDGTIARLFDPEIADNVLYTEHGDVRCMCPRTGRSASMVFWGFEKQRDTLKYRCPAAAYGWTCPGRGECESAAIGRSSDFGRVVRVPLDFDRRIFTPIPRYTRQWRRLYARRTSVERVNARIDQGFGFELHTIRGLEKMRTRMGIALAVMIAMAVGFIARNRPDLMRSLVGSTRRCRLAA